MPGNTDPNKGTQTQEKLSSKASTEMQQLKLKENNPEDRKGVAEKQIPRIIMDQSAFISMKSLDSGSKKPTNFNVGMGDKIAIPLYSETAQSVIIRWTQGNELKELGRWFKATSTPSHTAAYTVMYGYNTSMDRMGREVLIFVATELISPAYKFHPLHLEHISSPILAEIKQSETETPCRLINVNRMWQYGTRGAKELFIVYHPPERRPFQGRFMTAIATNPTALDGSAIHNEVTIKQQGATSGTTIDTPFGDFTIPSSMTMLAGKQALSTASGLWSSFKGDPLKAFNDDGVIQEARDLKAEEIKEVDKQAGALEALKYWWYRGSEPVVPISGPKK